MALYKNKYRVESNRLKNWDYSGKGIYFLTICCRNRECHLGEVVNGNMIENEKGRIVSNEIINSTKIRNNWIFHNWIIMPNHIHLLIEIKESMPKFNFSTKRIIHNATDVEIINAFLNFSESIFHKETHCGASQHEIKDINEEPHCGASQQEINDKKQRELMENFKRKPKSISSFVAQLKSKISKQINELENTKDSIWQSNYHDSIITSPEMFKNVYFYIQNNPKNWEKDSLKK